MPKFHVHQYSIGSRFNQDLQMLLGVNSGKFAQICAPTGAGVASANDPRVSVKSSFSIFSLQLRFGLGFKNVRGGVSRDLGLELGLGLE